MKRKISLQADKAAQSTGTDQKLQRLHKMERHDCQMYLVGHKTNQRPILIITTFYLTFKKKHYCSLPPVATWNTQQSSPQTLHCSLAELSFGRAH